jgi:hypothetical protein
LLLFADALGGVDFGHAVFEGYLGIFAQDSALEELEAADDVGARPRSMPAS